MSVEQSPINVDAGNRHPRWRRVVHISRTLVRVVSLAVGSLLLVTLLFLAGVAGLENLDRRSLQGRNYCGEEFERRGFKPKDAPTWRECDIEYGGWSGQCWVRCGPALEYIGNEVRTQGVSGYVLCGWDATDVHGAPPCPARRSAAVPVTRAGSHRSRSEAAGECRAD